MEVHLLARQLNAMRQRVVALSVGVSRAPGDDGLELDATLEALGTTLEALQTTEQHLREQNEKLAVTHHELERERQRYKELFDLAPDGYLTTDLTGIVREANYAAKRLLRGRSRTRLVGWPMISCLPKEERGPLLNELTRLKFCASDDTLRDREIHLEPADAPALTLSCTVSCARGADGRLVGFRWLLRDITERKQAEDAACREKEFVESLIRTAQAAVLVLSPGGRILRSNPFLQTLTGYTALELEGQDWLTLFVPESDRSRLADLLHQLHIHGAAPAEQARLQARDGTVCILHWTGSIIKQPGAPSILLVGHDVTELQEAQTRALQAERLAAIGQMVTGLAHESRNALQRGHACLEMLALEARDNPRALELIARVQEAQTHLTRLYEEVRQFAAPVRLERHTCRMVDVWRPAWEILDRERMGRQALLREEGIGGELPGHIDALHMRQVFRNLFENALAACRDPVEILVACVPMLLEGRPAVQITVRDNGPGLNDEQRQHIFDPFYTTKTRGTGLGMTIARSIIEAHGGAIFVGDGAAPGAEIIFLLPLEES